MLSYLPDGISSFAGDIDRVMSLIYWICGVWFVVAELILVWLVVRGATRKEGRSWMPAESWGARGAILVPASLVLACDLVIEAHADPVWRKVKIDIPEHGVHVGITGRQFAWVFTYPGPDGELWTRDDLTATELHVPKGEVVRFELRSADVLHAFFVRELRLKQDAVPGRTISGWFDADTEGSYEVACAELCGKAHTGMAATMVVESRARFDSWLKTL